MNSCLYTKFQSYRRNKIKVLEEHIKNRRVDPELIEWLVSFNKSKCLVTTSSCSGRLTLHKGVNPLDKKNSALVRSWHNPSQAYSELCKNCVYIFPGEPYSDASSIMWLSLQPPIIHIVSPLLDLSMELLNTAVRLGMRRSCIRKSKYGWQLEVKSGDKSIYYFKLPPDCNIIKSMTVILFEYKKRFYSWMNYSLGIPKKHRCE